MKKVYGLSNINQLLSDTNNSVEDNTDYVEPKSEEGEEENEGEASEERVYRTVATSSLVTVIAYMLGMTFDRMEQYYGEHNAELMVKLKDNREATIIRYLNRLRTGVMLHFKDVDNEIKYNMGNIDRMEWFSAEEIRILRKWGIETVQVNYRADKYTELFCGLIADHIDACKSIFPDWVNFDYIRDLFIIPKFKKPEVMKEEYYKYMSNLNNYPFQMYIHWTPGEYGNILYSDGKFLTLLYEQHGDMFHDRSKYRDAVEDTKKNIYDYIDHCRRVMIVVDCENSDVFKLHAVLKNLDEDEMGKIEKIILYDDVHTSSGWDWLEKFVTIPVEHVEVDRVTEHKSLVDLRMTAGICQAYYRDNIDAYILCSSDSDFWGVISAIPEANFLVLYEYSKCGKDIKDALTLRNIYHCSMDDFYTGNAGEIRRVVLRKSLERETSDLIGKNGYELTRKIFADNYIEATESEIRKFYDKYVQTLKLKIDEDGCFYVDIAE